VASRSIFTKLFWKESAFSGLFPALRPTLLHRLGYPLAPFRTQFALARGGCCGSIFASLWTTRTGASGRRRCSSEQCTSLLQLQYLCVKFSDNATNFHVLPPFDI
jgi:hypothetical protein